MVIIGNEIHCVEVRLRKGDDFQRVFSLKKMYDGSALNLSLIDIRWDFFKSGSPIFSLYGDSIQIIENQALCKIPAALFASLPLIGKYTHRFYDTISNSTLFEGPVQITAGESDLTFSQTIFYGPVAESVSDSDDVKALPSSAYASQGPLTLATGSVYKKFVIAIPDGYSIQSIIDQSAINIDVTAEYEQVGDIEVTIGANSVTYTVFEMNLAVPYSISHNHLITVTNG